MTPIRSWQRSLRHVPIQTPVNLAHKQPEALRVCEASRVVLERELLHGLIQVTSMPRALPPTNVSSASMVPLNGVNGVNGVIVFSVIAQRMRWSMKREAL